MIVDMRGLTQQQLDMAEGWRMAAEREVAEEAEAVEAGVAAGMANPKRH